VFGELASHKVPGHRTIGAYALFEVATQPDVHHREDGAFYVLEDEFEFSAGDTTLWVEAGSLLYSPKGPLHAHERTSVRGPAGRW
jgi:mannose-6-phosphate isomerase-like protein (cupin superfamily)